MQTLLSKVKGDKVIWMIVLILSVVSLLAVYSSISSLALKAGGNSFKFLLKHGVMLAMGFGLIYVIHNIPSKYFSKLSQLFIWVAAIMLLLTLIVGIEVNEAKRWLRIPGLALTFQTSDFAKVVLIVYVARMLNVKRTQLHDFKNGVLPILAWIGVICALILPADFSTAAMLGFICFVMLMVGGVPFKHLLKVMGIIAGALGIIYLLGTTNGETFPRFGTWKQRIDTFFNTGEGDSDPSETYQIDRAQFAIYDGGLFPAGAGSGSARNFLPHPYSDMIFAFIIQEYGSIFGAIGLVFLYIILMYRCVKMANKSPSHFGGLAVVGLGFMMVFQAMINMGVAVNILPTTGQPLPMVSMGGTSILFTALALGIILSISRLVYNSEENEEGEENTVKGNHLNTPKEPEHGIA
ncbi:MAG: FtsW/RodA/SpoVE family cell cycle protein [Flavobacteriales bacterium]|nr:FtsW/RodA/SpoVE family cell cycle protein [Flavobacteriales bacterium]